MKNFLIFLTFALSSLTTQASAAWHQRDYSYSSVHFDEDADDPDDSWMWFSSTDLCVDCFFSATWEPRKPYFTNANHRGIDFSKIPRTSTSEGGDCVCSCDRRPIYSGYLHFIYKNGFPFLKKQIEFTAKYPHLQAYWPETSPLAMHISEVAVPLFEHLFASTALSRLQERSLAKDFFVRSWYFDHISNIRHVSLCATCFRFSDYHRVCHDLKLFSQRHFSKAECLLIQDKMMDILDELAPLFRQMYAESLATCETPEMQEELEFIQNFYDDWTQITLACPICKCGSTPLNPIALPKTSPVTSLPLVKCGPRNKASVPSSSGPINTSTDCYPLALPGESTSPPKWCSSSFYLLRGIHYNDLFLYEEALKALNTAAELATKNPEIYLERAHAYFELGQFDKALADYAKYKEVKGDSDPKRLGPDEYDLESLGATDYGQGLCLGILQGSRVSIEELGPNLVGSLRGLLQGLWAFACSPMEVSSDIIQASQALVQAIRSQSTLESLKMVVPELRDLCENWDTYSDHERGHKVGFMIGKYGVDIFLPGACIKVVQKYRALKAANTAFTLECMTLSQAQREAIFMQSAAKAGVRQHICETAKAGEKLLLKNAHQANHIMTDKHAWGKVITLTGNVQEDCSKALNYIQKNQIVHPKNLKETVFRPDEQKPLKLCNRYKKQIGNETIEVIMETSLETGETTVQNAWIMQPKERIH